MPHTAHLAWPFFDDSHRALAREVDAWAARELAGASQHADLDQRCRDFVRRLGVGGWLRHAVPAPWGGARESLDLRSICLVRETLARHDALAEFCFRSEERRVGREWRDRWPRIREGLEQ